MRKSLLILLSLGACAEGQQVSGYGFTAVDGDTLRGPAGERIRLAGIDAPELPGHCRVPRCCAIGDPFVARDALAGLVEGAYLICEVEGIDRYDRLLANCRRRDDQADLGAWLVGRGYAEPWRPRQ